MALKKLTLRPGVNRENTRYTSENGWYESDKIRFRQGTPEKIGGWQRISADTFLGVCRSLWNWITLGGLNLVGVGTNLKFYIESGGEYNDITPLRSTVTLTNPFTTTSGSSLVVVADAALGYNDGAFVSFSPSTTFNGVTISGEYRLIFGGAGSYTIDVGTPASSSGTGGGVVTAAYQINPGPEYAVPVVGWGAGAWGSGGWGVGGSSSEPLRVWSQANFGEDLVFGYRGGPIYYWVSAAGPVTRAVALSSLGGTLTVATLATPSTFTLQYAYPDGTAVRLNATSMPTGLSTGVTYYLQNVEGLTCNLSTDRGGASLVTVASTGSGMYISSLEDVPQIQNYLLVSDTSRFVFAFGTNNYGSSIQNLMLVRWSDQESATIWYPQATNQAGSVQLSRGSKIVTAIQSRQEILVWTDSSLYSFQYVGAPVVWKNELIGENISIVGQNAVGYANGVAFWMGVDKFYAYDGRAQTLPCDLRQFVFSDPATRVNTAQFEQVCCGTNEGFNEIWWFYPAGTSNVINTYVVYNYVEKVWYYGAMGRTAWLDTGLRNNPLAATYLNNLVNHEVGTDDESTATPQPIEAYISSAEFDIDDGYKVGFIWRMLPDITFRGSSAGTPSVVMTLRPMQNSGSGYNEPESVGGINSAQVARIGTYVVEEFTGQINTRVRGRQIVMEVRSTGLGVQWQLGSPRIDIRPDGRR